MWSLVLLVQQCQALPARHRGPVVCRDALHLGAMGSFLVTRVTQDHAVRVEGVPVAPPVSYSFDIWPTHTEDPRLGYAGTPTPAGAAWSSRRSLRRDQRTDLLQPFPADALDPLQVIDRPLAHVWGGVS